MTGRDRAAGAAWSVAILVGGLVACLPGDRQRFSRAEAIKHLEVNRAEFDRIAADWFRDHQNDSIYFRPWAGDVRWNSTVISLPTKDSRVKVMRDTTTQLMSFDAAAETAGVSSSALRALMSQFQRLGIAGVSVIGTRAPEQNRYLQIDLQEGGAHYGYLFVPPGHKPPFSRSEPSWASHLFDYVQDLGQGWLYFESK
jgi:hypothetical protein